MKESEDYNEIWEKGYGFPPVKVDPNMKDHSDDPFFVKKLEEAKKTFEKIKFPPNWRDMK